MHLCIIRIPLFEWRSPRGVMVKMLDCGIVESEFERQLHYNVHFRKNTVWNVMNPFIVPTMG